MSDNFMDFDLEIEAALKSEPLLDPTKDNTNDTNPTTEDLSDINPTTEDLSDTNPTLLVSDEPYDRFEPLPRPTALFLYGVNDLSTSDIESYINSPLLSNIEWINDTSCNLVFATPSDALLVSQSLLKEPQALDHRTLVPAKPCGDADLFVRVATDEDIKVRGARSRSVYYQIHGVKGQAVSKERREERKSHHERMRQNGGDGRDVFSRLGRRQSLSPSRRSTRSSPSRRSPPPRDIPDHLKKRLGVKVKKEEEE